MKINLLNPEIISNLDNLMLKARVIVEGFMVGIHRSPFHGFSVEFSEHKGYAIGDDIKHLDWKLWAKTDKYYIKQFEEETNLQCHIFFDMSKSMSYNSHDISKIQYAQMLTAALGYLIINQQDSLGLTLFDKKVRTVIPPKSSKSHLKTIISVLNNIVCGPETKISKVLHQGAEMIHKKGLIILISDLFDNPKDVIESLKHFRYKKNEVIVFHILDPQELELKYNEQIMFEDLETKEQILTEPWHIQKIYKKEIGSFLDHYQNECRKNKISYNLLTTNISLDYALSEFLNKRRKSF